MFSSITLTVHKRTDSMEYQTSVEEAVMRHLKEAKKVANKLSIYLGAHIVTPCLLKINCARSHRFTSSKSSGGNSSSGSSGDPDPEPAPFTSFIFYCKPVIPYISFISLISLFSFIITSTLEVMK